MHSAVLRLPGSILYIAILIIAKGARWRNLSINISYATRKRIHDFCQRRIVLEQATTRLINALHDEAIDESFPAACFNESSAPPLPTMRQAEGRRKSTGLTAAAYSMQATCTNGLCFFQRHDTGRYCQPCLLETIGQVFVHAAGANLGVLVDILATDATRPAQRPHTVPSARTR